MDNNQSKNNTSLYIIILIGCFVIGGFYYLTKTNEKKLELQLQENERLEKQQEKNEETSIRLQCNNDAIKEAQDLLKSKTDILENTKNLSYSDKQLLTTYKDAISKEMYLKEDFNSLYEQCLSRNGLK